MRGSGTGVPVVRIALALGVRVAYTSMCEPMMTVRSLYPELGITSRAALRATLETMAPGHDDQAPQSPSLTKDQDDEHSRTATHD
ncbi:hypothetical protein ACWDA7_44120 [Streptomyces sp. NPDC001156]